MVDNARLCAQSAGMSKDVPYAEESRLKAAHRLEQVAAQLRLGVEPKNIEWISYTPDEGEWDRESAAKAYAAADLTTDLKGEQWPDDMDQVFWGLKISVECARQTGFRESVHEDPDDGNAYYCGYELASPEEL